MRLRDSHLPTCGLSALLLLAGLLRPSPLPAQSAPAVPAAAAAAAPTQLERLVVTGSNIQRAEMEKVAPVTVLDQTAIDVRGGLLPVDLLTSLPSVVNLPEN